MKNETGKIEKILVPVDFSECSGNALEVAGLLARKLGASLVVFHAYHVPVPAQQYGSAPLHYDIGDLYAEESDRLKIFISGRESLNDIKVERKVSPCFAHDGILSVLDSDDIDLIVMGTKGASGVKGIFMGSITYRIINESNVPVLSVPPDISIDKGIKRMAFGADCKAIEDEACFKPVIALARAFDADTHIIHVGDKRCLDLKESLMARDLNMKLMELHPSFHFVIGSDIGDGLDQYVRENDIDLLILLPRHHNVIDRLLQKSNTKKVSSRAETPLLTLVE